MIYSKKREILKNEKRCKLKSGDIIQFPCYGNNFPIYSLGEYGIIVHRIRVITTKSFGKFYDYYAQVMMLSGKKSGKERIFNSSIMYHCNKITHLNELMEVMIKDDHLRSNGTIL